jgi:hypothetical protein
MPFDLLKVSFALQVAIASGYLAYLIAYAGIRQHHTAADALLKSFVFGVIATGIFRIGPPGALPTTVVAAILPLVAAMLWRWLGIRAWAWLVRKYGISWADDIPTAWLSITATRTDFSPTQISVETLDGRLLFCDDTRRFADAHEGPASFGLSGDLAFYVTDERRADGEWVDKKDVRHADEGDLLTYLPASQIKRVEIRYLSGKVARAAAKKAKPAGAQEASAEPSPEYNLDATPSSDSAAEVLNPIPSPAAQWGASRRPRSHALLGVAAAVSSFALWRAFDRRSL